LTAFAQLDERLEAADRFRRFGSPEIPIARRVLLTAQRNVNV
jgi:hypothetical protein